MSERLKQARDLSDYGRYAEATEAFQALIREGIDAPNAHLGIAVCLIRQNKHTEAIEYLQKCGVKAPEILVNLALCYQKLGDETEEMKVLAELVKTRWPKGEGHYRRVANWAIQKEMYQLAFDALLAVFELNGSDESIYNALADTAKKAQKVGHAITFLLRMMEMTEHEERRKSIHGVLAGIYKDSAIQPKAIWHFQEAYKLGWDRNSASNLIMTMQYTHGIDFIRFYEQCREYSRRFLTPLPKYSHALTAQDPGKAGSGLRIGFVSGDFITHSLANLLMQPFSHFKKVAPQHTYVIYSSREATTEKNKATESYKGSVDLWRCIHGMSDAEAAELIRTDAIDVLVEIAGHTGYNRLGVFGYKPAPVQVGWVSGMMTPPGIETINYFLTDPWIRPERAHEICFEKLIELPAAYCYFPLANAPSVGELPAKKRGYVSFGSFNNPCKISQEVLETWAKCLHGTARSRIHIKIYNQETEARFKKTFRSLGITDDRVVYVYNLPRTEDVMAYYTNEVDVVLDTWPCAGCLTSAEAMWMGAPVMTLVGETFLHRQTWTILKQIGLAEEFGADSLDGFVAKTKKICNDLDRLAEIRGSLRTRMEAAPIRDAPGMANSVVNGLESAWQHWCEKRQQLASLVS